MKKIFVFVPIFLISLILFSSIAPVISKSEEISSNVFRLHIIANSNSDEDQALKLKIRDEILRITEDLYNNCSNLDEAIKETQNNKELLEKTAQKVIDLYGFPYKASAFVDKEYFTTREYDNFTLPAGNYNCLKIVIGEGKGKNWWCVMFPSVCISGCTNEFEKTLTKDEIKMLKSDNYKVRFKIVEIYERIKSERANN